MLMPILITYAILMDVIVIDAMDNQPDDENQMHIFIHILVGEFLMFDVIIVDFLLDSTFLSYS